MSFTQRLGFVPAPMGCGGAGKSFTYRTKALSWSFSNVVPKSRSSRSAISCQVRPAAFMSLRTVNAFPSDRSSVPIPLLVFLRNAMATSRRRLLAKVSAFTPSFRGRIVALRRRGRSQYGLLQAGQRAGFLGVRGHHTLTHRWHTCWRSSTDVSFPDASTLSGAAFSPNTLEAFTFCPLEIAPPFYKSGAFCPPGSVGGAAGLA